MPSLPGDDAGIVQPVARTPTTVVDGDVVLSGVVLIFVALALAFVLYHYLTAHRRLRCRRGAAAAGTSPDGRRGVRADAASAGHGVDLALPVTLFRGEGFAEAPECAVCLANLAEGEAAGFLPKCGHGFHAECVDLWLRSHPTCPLCRVDVRKPDASPAPGSLPALPPEPANYGTNLPANVLFWGSQDAVAASRTVGAAGGHSSSGELMELLVIEVRERETTAPPPPPAAAHGGDAAKPQGWAVGRG